ncbi:VPLPA-CTERM sorting domain-containing protein [Roseospira marina]|uniref:VPLPA-CTERM sorting domain-containing protein n=1 Tax=Roseospira marina TaxID=140057 RepID=A0A5M6I8Q8_9PROT|nr:VPLPA-CTERM sorting domain-containing protein [Roseospira marina]KAA5604644.1 VPLPA-CTERM sorting domain-containing protein [Roseospira marina]MBB4315087.1 hypothetical protein [Roseospira marina]MBB5088143.1 hypothetical protein [Roseospira marina]
MKAGLLSLAAGAFALTAASANAAVLDFGSWTFDNTFWGTPGASSHDFALADGLTLTATAGNYSTGRVTYDWEGRPTYHDPLTSKLGRSTDGFSSWTAGWWQYDPQEIDGTGPNEYIELSFNKVVDLNWIDFSYVGSNDDVSMSLNGSDVPNSPTDTDPFYFLSGTSGSVLRLDAFGNNNDFTIKSLSYDIPAEVPLPAAAWFMLTALGGLAGGRWLRKGTARAAA